MNIEALPISFFCNYGEAQITRTDDCVMFEWSLNCVCVCMTISYNWMQFLDLLVLFSSDIFLLSVKKNIISKLLFYLKCFLQPEHQQLIVDSGALIHLVDLLKRHKDGLTSRAINSLIRRAADAITNLAHENSSIKTRVRFCLLLRLAYLKFSLDLFLILLS